MTAPLVWADGYVSPPEIIYGCYEQTSKVWKANTPRQHRIQGSLWQRVAERGNR